MGIEGVLIKKGHDDASFNLNSAMGYVTIEEGEQALLYNAQGQGQLILGPRRVS